jgi:hypothetical protein
VTGARGTGALAAYLQLVRLPATFSAWSNILAAHLIATGGQPHWRLLLLQLAATTALYWAGMVLNDCFDLAEDRRERPGRPLPAGRIPLHRAWTLGAGLMATGLVLAAAIGWEGLGIALALGIAILAYDGLLKGGPLGPPAMGACRYLNWLLGLAVAPLAVTDLLLPLPVLLYTAAVTVLSGAETRGPESRVTWTAAALLGAAALALVALVAGDRLSGLPLVAGLAAGLVLLADQFRRMAAAGGPAAVQSLVRLLLFGMIPLDALLLLGSGHALAAAALLLLLLPGRLLARRLYLT